jgi:coniferyl-aldehyde dehydrogenase
MNAQPQAVPDTRVDLGALLRKQRAAHQAHAPDYAERIDALERLRSAFKQRVDNFTAAMSADFGRRSRHESMLSDVFTVLHEIDHVRAHLRQWMKPTHEAASWQFWPARGELRYRPLGVVGVISTWNYPVNISLIPLASALAAGNHVMLKPSEHTPRTGELLKSMLADLFPEERVATVLGGPEMAAEFAALPFDHLMFTGSTQVGRLVMQAAAANLTPVTLELGGKSPTLIADDYPIETAADRIAAGKFINAGQTCIAPDYVLLPKARIAPFVEALRRYVQTRYQTPDESADYTSIVNERQYQRLKGYLDDARARGAEVIELGRHDDQARVLAPTVVLNAPDDASVMQEEIFGPILPLVEASRSTPRSPTSTRARARSRSNCSTTTAAAPRRCSAKSPPAAWRSTTPCSSSSRSSCRSAASARPAWVPTTGTAAS